MAGQDARPRKEDPTSSVEQLFRRERAARSRAQIFRRGDFPRYEVAL